MILQKKPDWLKNADLLMVEPDCPPASSFEHQSQDGEANLGPGYTPDSKNQLDDQPDNRNTKRPEQIYSSREPVFELADVELRKING